MFYIFDLRIYILYGASVLGSINKVLGNLSFPFTSSFFLLLFTPFILRILSKLDIAFLIFKTGGLNRRRGEEEE